MLRRVSCRIMQHSRMRQLATSTEEATRPRAGVAQRPATKQQEEDDGEDDDDWPEPIGPPPPYAEPPGVMFVTGGAVLSAVIAVTVAGLGMASMLYLGLFINQVARALKEPVDGPGATGTAATGAGATALPAAAATHDASRVAAAVAATASLTNSISAASAAQTSMLAPVLPPLLPATLVAAAAGSGQQETAGATVKAGWGSWWFQRPTAPSTVASEPLRIGDLRAQAGASGGASPSSGGVDSGSGSGSSSGGGSSVSPVSSSGNSGDSHGGSGRSGAGRGGGGGAGGRGGSGGRGGGTGGRGGAAPVALEERPASEALAGPLAPQETATGEGVLDAKATRRGWW